MTAIKISKSWILTIIAFVFAITAPIANDALTSYGIIITEAEMSHYLAFFLSVAGLGSVSAIRKQLKSKQGLVQEQGLEIPKSGIANPSEISEKYSEPVFEKRIPGIPKLSPSGNWYRTNFRKDPTKGNVLDYGQSYLWVAMDKVRSYMTIKLMAENGAPIQIDQSHEFDEDNNIGTVRLELFEKDGNPLPRGKYSIQVRGDAGTSDATEIKDDKFHII